MIALNNSTHFIDWLSRRLFWLSLSNDIISTISSQQLFWPLIRTMDVSIQFVLPDFQETPWVIRGRSNHSFRLLQTKWPLSGLDKWMKYRKQTASSCTQFVFVHWTEHFSLSLTDTAFSSNSWIWLYSFHFEFYFLLWYKSSYGFGLHVTQL